MPPSPALDFCGVTSASAGYAHGVDKTAAQTLSNCIIVRHALEWSARDVHEILRQRYSDSQPLGLNYFRGQGEMNILFDETEVADFGTLTFKEIGSLFD